jgi:hypothetical protein
MENERQCNLCGLKGTGDCLQLRTNEIVSAVPKINENKTEEIRNQAAQVNKLIAEERDKARENGCLNVNGVDPDYPGKKLL